MNTKNSQTKPLDKTTVISWFLSLQFIFRPKWWLMNQPYSKEVDEIILELLEKHEFKNICSTKCTAELGKATIWIENRPYQTIYLYDSCLSKFRPSRLTILKGLNKLKKLEEQEKVKEVSNYLDCVTSIRRKLGLN